ncbi:unnamed protein product [Arctogadus glacialis]
MYEDDDKGTRIKSRKYRRVRVKNNTSVYSLAGTICGLSSVSSRSAHQQVSGPLTGGGEPPTAVSISSPRWATQAAALPSPGAGGITPLEPLSRMVFWIQLASFQGSVDYGTWRNVVIGWICIERMRSLNSSTGDWSPPQSNHSSDAKWLGVASMTTRRRSLVPSPVAWWLPAGCSPSTSSHTLALLSRA